MERLAVCIQSDEQRLPRIHVFRTRTEAVDYVKKSVFDRWFASTSHKLYIECHEGKRVVKNEDSRTLWNAALNQLLDTRRCRVGDSVVSLLDVVV